MNIFVTSPNPIDCARNLDKKRIVKMIVETAQLLCTALRWHGCTVDGLYKSTHVNHPCSIWARETRENYFWLCEHGIALCMAYTEAYGKSHKTEDLMTQLPALYHHIPEGDLTPFADCTEFKDEPWSIFQKYQALMNLKWSERDKYPPQWVTKEPPYWAEVDRT